MSIQEDQIPSTEPQCPPVHYDFVRQCYWTKNKRDEWITINETSLRRHLRQHGFSPKRVEGESLSPLDACFNKIQNEFDVAYAGPLAGYPKGPVTICGRRILVTDSAKLITPEERPHSIIEKILWNMLGEQQLPYFQGWLKTACESQACGIRRPGQALVLAGKGDSYKSLLQNLITEILGGRSAKPYRYMSGATEFNGDLFGAEHLMIEDDIASCDIRARRNFGTRIKEFTVNEVQSCHPKNRPALSLTPFWRMTISVNDEPENLLILPPLDESLKDKLILLKASKQESVMPTITLEERKRFWQALLAELPGFIWKLMHWEIPADIKGGRFGVLHFHHPDLLQALEDAAPETKVLALIDTAFKHGVWNKEKETKFEGTAEELESQLMLQYPADARRLFTWSNAVGTYLGRLADKYPERVQRHRTASERLWIVKPAGSVTS